MWRKRKRRKIGERKVDRETECDPSAVSYVASPLTSHCNYVNFVTISGCKGEVNIRILAGKRVEQKEKPDEKGMERNRK